MLLVACEYIGPKLVTIVMAGGGVSFFNTLALRGLEELFYSCAVVSGFGSGGE